MNKEVESCLAAILESLQYELKGIEKGESDEIYFHDIVNQDVDAHISPLSRSDLMEIIDSTGNEEYADDGILDKSSLDRFVITMAYECLHQELFNEDFMQELQDDLNNETLDFEEAQILLHKIEEYKHDNDLEGKAEYKDSETQIYVHLEFPLIREDFKEPYFQENQFPFFTDTDFKILTSNKEVNQNAIIVEGYDQTQTRIYLMQKDKDLDIRDFFKYTPTIRDMDYSLNPKDYVEGQLKTEFKAKDKKQFVYIMNQMSLKLTERSIEQKQKENALNKP